MDSGDDLGKRKVITHPVGLRVRRSPFIGTIAVAPEREVETSIFGQGSWGGNMDVRDICPGTRVLIPCYHKGALLLYRRCACLPRRHRVLWDRDGSQRHGHGPLRRHQRGTDAICPPGHQRQYYFAGLCASSGRGCVAGEYSVDAVVDQRLWVFPEASLPITRRKP